MMKLRSLPILLAAAVAGPLPAAAQQAPKIVFESDLPRVMVFLQEDGATAATVVSRFLTEAGFEVIDPSFAKTATERERARLALAGDEMEATALGRDLGAQVIILGDAPTDAAPNPVDASLQVGTAQVNVRALRLDDPRTVATGSTTGRAVEATPGGAENAALSKAVESLLYQTAFLGDVATDWGAQNWNDEAYWQPEQETQRASGSVAPITMIAGAQSRGLTLTIIESRAVADTTSGTRGITVVSRPGAGTVRATVRGIVSDPNASVLVGTRAADVRPLDASERLRYNVQDGAMFEASLQMPGSQDTLRVSAQGAGGVSAELVVRPMVGKRWAVLIGVSRYADDRIRALRYAENDARAMYDFLRSPAGGSVPDDQIRMLLNEDATADAIRDALFVFLQQAGPSDHVTVYVASHGAPDPNRPANLYILPYDTDVDAVASTAFPMWDFKTAVRRQIAAERVVVFADACHSAGTLVQDENPIGGAFADMVNSSWRLTLSAADTNELSRESARWGDGHGVFTYTLLQGLSGQADSDGDGVVTFAEASAYVQAKVAEETSGEQNPKRAGVGDLPLGYVSTSGNE